MIVTDAIELRKGNGPAAAEEIDGIIRLLEEELRASPRTGIGLAAPQIGIHKRVAIVRTKSHSLDLVNPTILSRERPVFVRGEGCLSVPDKVVDTCRFEEVFFRCDRNPAGVVATGIEALAVQHEIDHLDGVLMMERAVPKGIGRNDPCPCGAVRDDGKPVKFKRCHGA
jgi:peptide deformylase